MALVIKSKNLKYLADKGCNQDAVATLKSLGIAIQLKEDSITFWNGSKGYKLGGYVIDKSELDSFMMFVLKDIADEKKMPTILPLGTVGHPAWMNAVQMNAQELSANVVALRDAKAMYQRVHGSSAGSVYVVVAFSEHLQIAAKIEHGVGLSMRAEGPALDDNVTVSRLKSQGMSLKAGGGFKYMSGHYTCNDEAPPAKVMGAVLFGSGIEFDTPLPKVKKVVEGSA